MEKTIGKNTLGGGSKMKVAMRDYEMSTHNLSYVFRNTQAPGTLVPFMCELMTPKNSFEINLNAKILTHPTIGPLFGSYKFQMDVFTVPIRLYNALLHNNALNVGLDMKKVKLPQGVVKMSKNSSRGSKSQVNPSSLLAYLGIRGFGFTNETTQQNASFNFVPEIAYYDIFKNYYANKQEPKFYTIGAGSQFALSNPNFLTSEINLRYSFDTGNPPSTLLIGDNSFQNKSWGTTEERGVWLYVADSSGVDTEDFYIEYRINQGIAKSGLRSSLFEDNDNKQPNYKRYKWKGLDEYPAAAFIEITALRIGDAYITLNPYNLTDIDKTREELLKLGAEQALVIKDGTGNLTSTYLINLVNDDVNQHVWNSSYPQYGLCLKTYQSDIFNNWIQTDWIDGENGINEITAIDTSSGEFKLDALILAKKVYNMLNRIAVSGGTYNDWIEAVYSTSYLSRAETPIYQGGASCEVDFQEVVSNSATEGEPLGTLAGKGVSGKQRGGFIKVKVDEPSYLIGICSITPRVDYCQGNRFDTVLRTLDDLHKPAMDGIGFQDLVTWKLNADALEWENNSIKSKGIGKQPAWVDYMTNYNRTFGEFAIKESEGFMCMNRYYDINEDGQIDASTYIDPEKWNYIFADTSLNAMNFWVQIGCDIKARRTMSAKMMPTL